MDLQDVIVYAVLVLCACFILYRLWKIFSKKQNNKCAGCDCECELRGLKEKRRGSQGNCHK